MKVQGNFGRAQGLHFNAYWIRKMIIKRQLKSILARIQYWEHLYSNKPYFGPVLVAGQMGGTRKPYMKKIAELEIKARAGKHFKILEIGSWAGESAILWADAIRQYNNDNGLVICIDPWMPYILSENIGISSSLIRMEKALRDEKIYKLFLYNISASGHESIIKPFKGHSEEILPILRDNVFDLVYVDGSHAYSEVIKDLRNCDRLVRLGGILCGDDLELQEDEIDVENAEEQKQKDFIIDPRSNHHFHPGVCLAVWEFFGRRVSCFEGFWCMRKTDLGWESVKILA